MLIELDSSQLQDEKINEQIRVMNAGAAFIRARENLAVAKNQAESDIDKAELTLHFAREDLKKYIEGEYPKTLKEAESRITIAEEELRRASGQGVRERQELIYLPAGSSFTAEVKIHESILEKVSLGLPVRLTLDALPGKTYTGRVSRIAPLPDPISMWLNPDLKVYNTEIYIDNETPELKTGMSCRAEITIERYRDAVYIPVQAVQGKAHC